VASFSEKVKPADSPPRRETVVAVDSPERKAAKPSRLAKKASRPTRSARVERVKAVKHSARVRTAGQTGPGKLRASKRAGYAHVAELGNSKASQR
jgi:hypothetical protein